MPRLSSFERSKFIILHDFGYNLRKIAEEVGCSATAELKVIQKYNEVNSIEDKLKCGRPKLLGERE